MSQTMPQISPENQEPLSEAARTVVSMAPRNAARGAEPSQETEGTVSLWLYLAGLMVTLSGLYAVNYGIEDSTYSLLTYGLAVAGYITSYVLRLRKISLQSLRVPILIFFGLIFIVAVSNEQGLRWLAPHTDTDDRSRNLQLMLVWLAILHSFSLSSDASVLFACVPCMTMIALVSTARQDNEVQNAFLMFIGSATFLMVHENYLRTQMASVLGRSADREKRIFGGQVLLTGFCVASALMLAHIVAVPIRSIGSAMVIPNALNQLNNQVERAARAAGLSPGSTEGRSIELATGPVSESDQPVLRVKAKDGLYWRGATYDYYTGVSFENRLTQTMRVFSDEEQKDLDRYQNYQKFGSMNAPSAASSDVSQFHIQRSLYDPPVSDMKDSKEVEQTVTILDSNLRQIYGAGSIESVRTQSTIGLSVTPAGHLITTMPLLAGSEVQVRSRISTNDEQALRSAPADLGEYPDNIVQRYLQRTVDGMEENGRLQDLADEIVKGKSDNYDKALAIQSYIASHCKYNLQSPAAPRGKDRVEYFLLEGKQGYCDSFAAAMTMLCRYANIPSRMASGYLPGDRDKDETYLVRQKHKHVWTEVYFPHFGWHHFDATEGAEDISIHNQTQTAGKKGGFLAWLTSHGWLPPTITLCVIALLVYLFIAEVMPRLKWHRAASEGAVTLPATNLEIVECYLQGNRLLARRGIVRPPHLTPDEFDKMVEETLADRLPELHEPLQRLTLLHSRFRYGQETATAADVQTAKETVMQIQTALSGHKGTLNLTPAAAQA